mmetsp:Transcript_20497/g.30812  ORF Transcript_20497/g.30812 Transcript_20497/m.30812 type:complete len:82 (+) Transcript_20497:1419-1664(+)
MVPTPKKWMPEPCRVTQSIRSNNTDKEQEPNHNQNSNCVEQASSRRENIILGLCGNFLGCGRFQYREQTIFESQITVLRHA